MTLIRTYDAKNGRDLLERQEVAPRSSTHGIMGARVALQAIKARVRETNRRQNFVRWSVNETAITDTWNQGTLYPVLFDTEHFATEDLKGRKVHCDPGVSWRFQCGEPAIYNIKGQITMLISYPAVVATTVQRVVVHLKHRAFKTNTIVYYEQSQQIAGCGVVAGATVAHYLRGWSLPIRDKIFLDAGDILEANWEFQGGGSISFIEEYTGYIAIQKTGEKYIDGGCYCG